MKTKERLAWLCMFFQGLLYHLTMIYRCMGKSNVLSVIIKRERKHNLKYSKKRKCLTLLKKSKVRRQEKEAGK